jgi:hypothetical protein
MCTDEKTMPGHCDYTNVWALQGLIVTAAFVALTRKAACSILTILPYCTLGYACPAVFARHGEHEQREEPT